MVNIENTVFLISDLSQLSHKDFNTDEIDYVRHQADNEQDVICVCCHKSLRFVYLPKKENNRAKRLEKYRKAGDKVAEMLNTYKKENVKIHHIDELVEETIAFAEGMALGNYQFIKYKNEKDRKKKENTLKEIDILSNGFPDNILQELEIKIEAVKFCRDLVNEPVSHLNAVQLAEQIAEKAYDAGIKVEVLNKKKIEALKMGGLLAVNKGSIDPPTFTILEWKPENAVNKKPLVLVGKGVVYDTGGLNIKTGDYMNDMKTDMAGAAMMASSVIAIANANLSVHVIALLPATDNRPNGNAYASGDVIKMYDGTHVEVINTDAEGRMILADALAYAKKYNPELVINSATLTGAAFRAIGQYGIVAMHDNAEKAMKVLKKSGEDVYERIAEFPFWDEYDELIKSGIADIKNIGGSEAGMITAGKFLHHFTDYPFIHLDIAGPAHLEKKDAYRSAGGTGAGVRLIFEFVKNYYLGK